MFEGRVSSVWDKRLIRSDIRYGSVPAVNLQSLMRGPNTLTENIGLKKMRGCPSSFAVETDARECD